MKLTRFEEVGILIVVELASHGDLWTALSDIGAKHGISGPYLKKVIRQLRRAGIVTSKEGSSGGYKLGIPPNTLTVFDVFSALGTAKTESHGTQPPICPLHPDCLPQKIHQRIEETILTYCGNVTVDQFIKKGTV